MERQMKMEAEPEKKRKRHFILWVLLIALGLLLLGTLLGELLCIPPRLLFPDMPPMWRFSLMYFMEIGPLLAVLGYVALAEKELLPLFRGARRGGIRGNTLKEFGLGILIGFMMNGACILAAWLHGNLDFSVGKFYPVYLLVTFLFVLIQSGSEEMLCRGYLYGALRERYPVWVAVAANSLLFGVLHLFNPGVTALSVLNIVLIGVALSLVMVVRESLWMAIAIHTMWNFTQSILFGLPNSGIVSEGSFLHLEAASGSLFYDAAFGVEGALSALVVELALCGWLFLAARKKTAANAACETALDRMDAKKSE